MTPLSEQVRGYLRTCGLSMYRISKETGIGESRLSRFLSGEGMRMERLDVLAKYLKLEVRKRKGRK